MKYTLDQVDKIDIVYTWMKDLSIKKMANAVQMQIYSRQIDYLFISMFENEWQWITYREKIHV